MSEERKYVGLDEARQMLGAGGECAWKGCQRAYKGRELPGDWRYILLTPVSLVGVGPEAFERLDVDGVLCPVHCRELWGRLKIADILGAWPRSTGAH